jgi:hypothetical protein
MHVIGSLTTVRIVPVMFRKTVAPPGPPPLLAAADGAMFDESVQSVISKFIFQRFDKSHSFCFTYRELVVA